MAICTDCDQDICGLCHGIDLRGFALCRTCRARYGPVGTAWEHPETRWSVAGFSRTLGEVLLNPRTFFTQINPHHTWQPAAIFGVLCMVIGMLFSTLWQHFFNPQFTEILSRYTEQFDIPLETARLYIFASVPLAALINYTLHVFMLFASLRIFGVKTSLSLTARIAGYAAAAYVLLIFPPIGTFGLGHFLMVVWLFNLEVSAVRWFFNLGFWRSMGVVLIPFLSVLMMGR